MMLVTHLEFSSLVTQWKIPQIPYILLRHKRNPSMHWKVTLKLEIHFFIRKMKGTERKLSNNSTQHSISKEQLQGGPLTKQDILDVYEDIFSRIGKFPGLPYKFQLMPQCKTHQTCTTKGAKEEKCRKCSMRKSGIWKH